MKQNILLISATSFEIKPFLTNNSSFQISDQKIITILEDISFCLDILITGVGIPFCSYFLTKTLSFKKYDIVIQVGICGSFKKNFYIGTVVNVVEDQFADLGIDDKGSFNTLFEKKLIPNDVYPFINGKLENKRKNNNYFASIFKIPDVKGITVNTTSGSFKRIENIRKKFNPDIESMEGASLFIICQLECVPCIQIRSVSNFVEPRNEKNWNIPLAIENLNNFLTDYFLKIRNKL